MAKRNSSGKLRARVQIGVGPEGKPINKYVSAKTVKELEALKEQVRRHYIDGEPIREDMLFCQYAEEWFTLKKEPFVSDSTKVSYRICFTKHLLPAFGLRHLRAISSKELQVFVNAFGGKSKSQITLVIGMLKALFSSAFADGITSKDVSCALVRPKAKKKTNRRALTASETKRVLETIKTHEHGLFLAVLYYLGLRRGEALGLKWGDFDWDDGTVHIQRDIDFTGSKAHEGDLKTDAAERYVPIPADLWKMLTPVRSMPDQLVFHTEKMEPLPQATYQRIWLSLMLETGCTEERDIKPDTNRPRDIRKQYKPTITPHYFRHNYVTLLYEAGIDPLIAMKLVGHTDYQTTASIYTHLKDEALKKAATNIEDVFAKRQAGKVSKAAGNGGKWASWGI